MLATILTIAPPWSRIHMLNAVQFKQIMFKKQMRNTTAVSCWTVGDKIANTARIGYHYHISNARITSGCKFSESLWKESIGVMFRTRQKQC